MPRNRKKKATPQKAVAKAVVRAVEKKVEQKPKKGVAPGLLGGIGRTIGSFFGGATGAGIGSAAGNWLGKITGMGAYKVGRNSLLAGTVPTFASSSGVTIAHREYIADLSGSTAFTLQSFAINPGQSTLFPWLAQVAGNFEEYQLLGMIVEFKSTSADALNSTNTALGAVIMATQYDDYDSLFNSKLSMENYEYSTSCKPSESMLHPIECDPRQNVLKNMFIRTGLPSVGSDLRFSDVGNFQVATVGMQAAAVIGELWVTYHVRLLKPRLAPTAPVFAHITEGPANSAVAGGTDRPFGTTRGLISSQSNLPVTATGNGIVFPTAGYYLVAMQCTSATTLTGQITFIFPTGGNIVGWPIVDNGGGISAGSFTTTVATILIGVHVTAAGTGANNTFTLVSPAGLTAGQTDAYVYTLPQSLPILSADRVLRRGSVLLDSTLARLEKLEAVLREPSTRRNSIELEKFISIEQGMESDATDYKQTG